MFASTGLKFVILFGKIGGYWSNKTKNLYIHGAPGSACTECSQIPATTNNPQTLPVCANTERLQVLARAKQKQRSRQVEAINARITKYYTCKEKGLGKNKC
jgi:hypothetical protein